MATAPWARDPVTPITVAAFIREQLPRLSGGETRFLSSSDFSTWEVDGRYILRFARDEESDGQLTREVAVLPVLEKVLPVGVPQVDLVAPFAPGLQVMGYPKLPGVDGEAFRPSPEKQDHLVGQFADLLLALRELSVADLPAAIPEWPGHDLELARRRLDDHGHLLAERAPEIATPDIMRYVHGDVPIAAPTAAPAVVAHADIKGEHLLFEPDAGCLTGVIDWADMSVTHPSIDLGALAVWLGPEFVNGVADRLGTPSAEVEQALAAVRLTRLAGLVSTFAGQKRRDIDRTKTMIRRAFTPASE